MPGRPRGAQSYSDVVLCNIVDSILPTSTLMWETVAEEYQKRTGEPKKRDGKDVKKHFIIKLCRSGKKPTGTSELTRLEAVAQGIYKKILDREHAANYGAVSSDDEDDNNLLDVPDCESDINSQISSCGEVDWTERDTELFLNEPMPAEDLPTTSTAPVAPSGIAMTPQSRKRPSPTVISGDTKSKNCRHNPRTNAASALSSLASTITENSSNNMIFLLMQQQQQQQQQQQNMFMQLMQQQTQMMMALMQNNSNNVPRVRSVRRIDEDYSVPQQSMNFDQL